MLLTQNHNATQKTKLRHGFDTQALSFIDNLSGVARHLTRNRADAEDLVQDTYMKALRFADRFHAGTNLKTWLLTILVNTHRNARRRAARDPVHVDSDTVRLTSARSDPADGPEHRLMSAVRHGDLRAALDSLPARFKQAVWLRDVDEYSYAEIAQMLAIPVGTVMSRISRGRRMLFERLTDGAAHERPALAKLGGGTALERTTQTH